MILSERLTAVTDLLPPGNVVADIGCDHGYISIHLVESQKYNRAIAMDVRKGPLAIANENINKYGYGEKIETRLSDGFEKLNDNEADAAIIAGMGGLLVISILERSLNKVKNLKQLVLQPQSDINLVRKYLRQHGFVIKKENMVKDEGKYYPMFLICFDSEAAFNDINDTQQEVYDYYGEYLIKSKNMILKEYVMHEKEVFESVLKKLPESNIKRHDEVKHRIKLADMCLDMMQ